jgi:acetyl-CoA synthetase
VLCFGDAPSGKKIARYQEFSNWPDLITNPPGFAAEHPLFILYTSGTTGTPKGIFHTTGGYLTQVVATTKWVFDLKPEDLYWCTADIGWITGHSYVVYGPLALGASIFLYDGALNYPNASRIYQLIDRHKINILYTAPTAIRMFMQAGEEAKGDCDLSSLRLLGSVGEPINPEAWLWYRRVFGRDFCMVIDSWWQTETGAMMIVPIEHLSRPKPGSASKAFLGINAAVVDDQGKDVPANKSGYLVIKEPWPSMARGIWGDQQRFVTTYFSKIAGVYFTGDGAKIDQDGDFIISGRIDDVINVAGHRLGTAEVESALVAHKSVAEAAVVGIADEITGQQLVAFVVLRKNFLSSSELAAELREHVKKLIGSFARPAHIYFETDLP